MLDLNGRVALVTGASRGLGRAMSIELAAAGAHVLVNYRQDEEAAKQTADEITALGAEASLIRADVGDAHDVEHLVAFIESRGLAVDILVNNGGTILRPGSWNEQSDEDLVRTVNMHLVGPIRLIRALAPHMIAQEFGRIVNITSTYAITGAAAVLSYTAAKAGLLSLTYAMARELGPHGITVNAIAPGNIDTALTNSAGEGVKEWAVSTTPLGRLGVPTEVAQALRYLMEADFVTGHVLVVDGGQLLNM